MICVLTLFGEVDLQPILRKPLGQNDIFFIDDNCNTSVQLMSQVEEHRKELDAVIIYANALNMEIIEEFVEELRCFCDSLRVVLILNGDMNSFLRSHINKYRNLRLDLIFDNDGFEVDGLIGMLRKGKISNKEFESRKKESGFVGDIEEVKKDYDISVNEDKKVFKNVEKRELSKKENFDKDSFSTPQCHFTIGVFNAARGAGATWTASNLARYLAMHNYKTCIADSSGTGAMSMIKLKNIDIYTENFDVEELKSKYNVAVIDFGTPIEVSPKGENFKLTNQYKPESIQCFNNCDIKLIMGFSEPWNIEKIKFFFINDIWREQFDNSYLFVIAGNKERVKKFFPDGNFFNRDEDYREHILDAVREGERK